VKKRGIYSQSQLAKTKKMFGDVVSKCPHIKCAYLAVEEVQTVVKKNSINFYCLSKTTFGSHVFFALSQINPRLVSVGPQSHSFIPVHTIYYDIILGKI
jgi:hypothetical protein